ncbi:MAG: M56 family metallopeptidase [Patiriisocius sp.]|uniref:M56 family metallopeptidase n=1 Tax=Patiriisocius sp. TaxID=2822396 RepID=UPI003EF968A4
MEAYILKSAACLALFYMFYKLVLEQQAVHTFKRFYLLGSLIAAAIIPSIVFTTYVEAAPVVFTNFPITSEIVMTETNQVVLPAVNYTPIIFWSIYGIGVLIFGSIFFRNLFQMVKKIQQNPKEKSVSVYRVLLQMATIPHTFFNYVFLNKTDYQNGNIPQEVLLHEEAHAVQKHSIDVLLIEILQVVFWFNPIIWLYKRSIKLNHEFLADRAVLNTGADAYEYSNLLLAFSSNASTPVLANSIIHSSNRLSTLFSSNTFGQVKKRLTVMKTTASKKGTLLRSLLLLPLLAALVYSFSSIKEVEKISKNIESQQAYDNWDAERLNEFTVSEEKPSLKVTIDKNLITVNEVKTTINGFAKAIDNVTENWTKKDFQLYRLSIQINYATEDFKTQVNEEYRKTKLHQQAKSKTDFLSTPPTPPSPVSFDSAETMDHVIAVAKKGKFFYNGAEISSDKAIELLKNNPEINLTTRGFDTDSPVTTFQDEPIYLDANTIKIFRLSVDFNTVIVNGNLSGLETFANDVDKATNDWTEKDFKQTQPRTTFKNANEEFLNKLDKEFKETRYSKAMGGMSIFWPHFKCKPEHLAAGNGYPLVTEYQTKNLSKEEIIQGLKNVNGEATTYYVNDNRATIDESIAFVQTTKISNFQIVEWNAEGKKDVYVGDKKSNKLSSDIPPPPTPAPKVLKGEKTNIPPPPPAPKAPKVLKGEKSNIPPPPPPPPAPKATEQKGPKSDNQAATDYFFNDRKSENLSEPLNKESQFNGLSEKKTDIKEPYVRYYYNDKLISLSQAGQLLQENQELRIEVNGSTGIITIVDKINQPTSSSPPKVSKDEKSTIPPPTADNIVSHIKVMNRHGPTFYLDNKMISFDEALKYVRKNKNAIVKSSTDKNETRIKSEE